MIKLSSLIHGKRGRVRVRGIKPSRRHELWYRGQLLSIVKRIRERTESSIRAAAKVHMAVSDGYAADSVPPWIDEIIKEARNSFSVQADILAKLAAKRIAGDVDSSFVSTVRNAIGIDVQSLMAPHAVRGMMDKATAANVYLIKSIPEEYFVRLQQAISDNWSSGMRPESLIDTIAHIGDVTESRAKLIARDQTSKMNSAFTQVRQLSVGINSYIWQTAGDERVRETHAMMDGQTVRWDEPPSTGHVGEDVNCRCVAIPILDKSDEEGFSPMGLINDAVSAYNFGVAAADLLGGTS